MKKKTNTQRLTLKMAKTIIRQEMSISADKLKLTSQAPNVYIYEMEMGWFKITVENDWLYRNGLFSLEIDSCMGSSMRIFYDPETLDENYDAGDRYRKEVAAERMELSN